MEIIKLFVMTIEEKGFDDEKDDFDLISRSDNQKLDLNKTLKQQFGQSDSEAIFV